MPVKARLSCLVTTIKLWDKWIRQSQNITVIWLVLLISENGYRNVQFHVRANLSCYTQVEIRKILETVADIVGCNSTEIVVNGYRHSSSFLVVLSIEKKHVKKLLTMKQQEKDKLSRLNIDYFIVDFIKVYLQSPQGRQYFGIVHEWCTSCIFFIHYRYQNFFFTYYKLKKKYLYWSEKLSNPVPWKEA